MFDLSQFVLGWGALKGGRKTRLDNMVAVATISAM
jgi:hypothetical protein